ncbi:hypothetical protein Pcinc_023930 [Petrolisthes cinctipes]|uniref:Uncharacterized protein n=1 Tax=Petrolisthes cinctipes TaxID=88211 RepID=A0AAE1FCI4_PETCI|nr:hypothetical protein Pcinc_023930 [Petrolisthes cinctipes]
MTIITEPEMGQSLSALQREDLKKLLREFGDVFSNTSGCFNTPFHDISLHTTDRVQAKVYPVPVHLKPVFEEEAETLVQQVNSCLADSVKAQTGCLVLGWFTASLGPDDFGTSLRHLFD